MNREQVTGGNQFFIVTNTAHDIGHTVSMSQTGFACQKGFITV